MKNHRFAFILELLFVLLVTLMAASTGFSVLTDSSYSWPMIGLYTFVVLAYLLWVRSFCRHWTDSIDGRIRTDCCHAGASRLGPFIRCNACGAFDPGVYDSEATDSVVGVSEGGDSR